MMDRSVFGYAESLQKEKQIQHFVESGLNKFYSSMTGNQRDNTFKIEIHDSRLNQGLDYDTIRQDLHLALERKDIDEFISQKTRNRCDQLILERNRVKKSLLESGEHEWLEGFDNITPASHDLLCITLYYPGWGGVAIFIIFLH